MDVKTVLLAVCTVAIIIVTVMYMMFILYSLITSDTVHPVKCHRCKYATRSKNHMFKYMCNRYVCYMEPFDYCSKGEEDE